MNPLTLQTPRLLLRQIQDTDWPLFRQLQRDPQVMRWVDAQRPEDDIAQRFHSRLTPWLPASSQWLTLLVIDRASGQGIGLHGFRLENPPL